MTSHHCYLAGAALAASLLVDGSATAHVVLSQAEAPAGGYYTAYFRVGHGCEGSPTTALRVEMPDGIGTARPQPNPGWTLRIEHQPLPTPVRGEGGRLLTERVSALTWTGGVLPDEDWDEFGLSAKLPARQGPLYFPAVQTCVKGEERWTDTPAPGQPQHALHHPAPVIMLWPPATDGGMAGMRMDPR